MRPRRQLLLRLLLLPALLLGTGAPTAGDGSHGRGRRLGEGLELAVSTEELLRATFEWNSELPGSQRYRTIVTHSRIATVGTVLVQKQDNPKEEDAAEAFAGFGDSLDPEDVLTAFPALGSPATARIQVDILSEHLGANRLHAFVHVNPEACHTAQFVNETHNFTGQECVPPYNAPAEVLSAVLAPYGDPSAVVRRLDLRMANYSTDPGEWHEVLGDFDVLPSEYGTGAQRIKLFVTLGSTRATAGTVSVTDLTLTVLPLTNVALGKPIADGGSRSARSAGYDAVRPRAISTTTCFFRVRLRDCF